jgi:TrmH family RNA methyltransferase
MITSMQNPKIQAVRALLNRRSEREAAQAFVAEGVRLVEEALGSHWPMQRIFFSAGLSERGQQLVTQCTQLGVEVEEVAPQVMEGMTGTETPPGLLAVLGLTPRALPARYSFVLICDAVRDPGNLGTLLRSAVAAGVQAVLCAPGTADAYAPKVVRSGMGAHFRLPVVEMDWAQIMTVCKPLTLWLAEMEGGTPCWSADFIHPLGLVVGGEAEGASAEARQHVKRQVYIPMPGGSESLNAAVAGSVLMFEVVRQRGA